MDDDLTTDSPSSVAREGSPAQDMVKSPSFGTEEPSLSVSNSRSQTSHTKSVHEESRQPPKSEPQSAKGSRPASRVSSKPGSRANSKPGSRVNSKPTSRRSSKVPSKAGSKHASQHHSEDEFEKPGEAPVLPASTPILPKVVQDDPTNATGTSRGTHKDTPYPKFDQEFSSRAGSSIRQPEPSNAAINETETETESEAASEENKETPPPQPLRRSTRLAKSGWKSKVKSIVSSIKKRTRTSGTSSSGAKSSSSSSSDSEDSELDIEDRRISANSRPSLSKSTGLTH